MGKSVARITTPPTVPPLRDGDRLARAEFLRRYAASKDVLRAELLGGVVYVNARRVRRNGKEAAVPPIAGGHHGLPQSRVHFWLEHYALHTPGVEASAPTSLHLPTEDSLPEPDALLFVLPECGGRAGVRDDDYVHGSPDLVVEVANTTGGRDAGLKADIYAADGVPEYLVWRTQEQAVEWYRLTRRRKYAPLAADAAGIVRSLAFPGLWLDVPALVALDRAMVFATAQQGIASPEHAAFVAKLAGTKARRKKK